MITLYRSIMMLDRMNNDCNKSSTAVKEVIPTISNDIKDIPTDESLYTTGISMSVEV